MFAKAIVLRKKQHKIIINYKETTCSIRCCGNCEVDSVSVVCLPFDLGMETVVEVNPLLST